MKLTVIVESVTLALPPGAQKIKQAFIIGRNGAQGSRVEWWCDPSVTPRVGDLVTWSDTAEWGPVE